LDIHSNSLLVKDKYDEILRKLSILFTQYLEDNEDGTKNERFIILIEDMGLWLLKGKLKLHVTNIAYAIIELLKDVVLQDIFGKKQCKELIDKLDLLAAKVTRECYNKCLVNNDSTTEITKGGYFYTFEDGTVS